MFDTVLVIFGGIVSFIAGYFFGKSTASKNIDLSSQSTLLSGLNQQIAEIKIKFLELEKRREEVEKEKQKNEELKDKHWEEFLKGHETSISNITSSVAQFQRLLFGTQQRGKAGENILKNFLKEPIKTGLIKTNLNVGNGVVEFALDLNDGKFIPIDSKVPDIFELLEQIKQTEDNKQQTEIKKAIHKKLENSVSEVTKYLNQPKTINKCILSVPDEVIELYPEMLDYAKRKNVFLASYSFTYLLAYVLYEDYQKTKAEGDLGEYKRNVDTLLSLVGEIQKRTETIDRGLKMAQNANEEISDTARKAKKTKD